MTSSEVVEHVRAATLALRTATDPIYARLRALLREREIDPHTTFVAQCFPDNPAAYFGVLVTVDCTVLQFWFEYAHGAEVGVFTEWEDETDSAEYQADPHCACALECAGFGDREPWNRP
jgi:hypothetical protein